MSNEQRGSEKLNLSCAALCELTDEQLQAVAGGGGISAALFRELPFPINRDVFPIGLIEKLKHSHLAEAAATVPALEATVDMTVG